MQALLQSLLLLFVGISITTASVWVNEVADKGDYTVCGGAAGVAGRDWVELYNDATSAADISGWKIHDDKGPDNIEAYIFPVGTILPPKSYTIFCQADSFLFGIGGADNVTLRNSNGEVVSTSGALLSLGSATKTYQLKDDHVTYAYAFPTPGKANESPTFSPTAVKNVTPTTKPTSRPVAKVTLSPSMKDVQSTAPSSRPISKVTQVPSMKKVTTAMPTATRISFNLIITELTDPFDKAGARYIELYSSNGAGTTIKNPNLYLIRWTNANAGPTNTTAVWLNGLTIGQDGFLVICSPTAANYTFSGYPMNTCDRATPVTGTGGPTDSNGDDNVAIVIINFSNPNGTFFGIPSGYTSLTVLDIYGVPGQQGSTTNGHYFQKGHAERLGDHLYPKSIWDQADWNSTYGNATKGFNVADMTPRKWNGARTTTNEPSLKPIVQPTLTPSASSSTRLTSKPTAKVTSQPVAKVTSKPTIRPSSKTAPSPSTSASVWVNEVADKGDYTVCGGAAGVTGRDWVELYNDATSAADISGWKLHDDRGPDNGEAYIFPVGTILPPKSYTIFCQADSFPFGINGVDNVTLRNANGEVVSTSGALLGFGSATKTYQLKDDHVTYAYAFPTPGIANVFPISFSSSPTFRATASPVTVMVTSSSPVARPSFSPNYSPKCKDSAWATFTGPSGAIKRCSDLSSKFLPQRRRNVCNSFKSNAATVCPDTCNGYCVNLTCSDSPKAKFHTHTRKHHYSCSKLSKLPVQDRRYICAFDAAASATCPSTCSGKC